MQTAGGIYLPDSKLGKTNEGEVIAVGPGRVTDTGAKIAVNVSVGDTVLLPEYGGTTLTLGDEELSLFRDEDILGKFQVRIAIQIASTFPGLLLALDTTECPTRTRWCCPRAFDADYFSVSRVTPVATIQ